MGIEMTEMTIVETAPALDTRQAAAFLGYKPNTLERWRCDGIGPKFVRVGNGPRPTIRYALADLRNFVGGR